MYVTICSGDDYRELIEEQLVEYLNQPLYGYYERLSSTFASTLNPTAISLPRTADDLLIAHLVYKCLFKISTWLWQRIGKSERGRNYNQWVGICS